MGIIFTRKTFIKFSIQHISPAGLSLAISNGAEGVASQSHSHFGLHPNTVPELLPFRFNSTVYTMLLAFLPLDLSSSCIWGCGPHFWHWSCPIMTFIKIKGFVLQYLCSAFV